MMVWEATEAPAAGYDTAALMGYDGQLEPGKLQAGPNNLPFVPCLPCPSPLSNASHQPERTIHDND